MTKNIFLSALFTMGIVSAQAQNFYDLNTVQRIEITFSSSNWDYRLDTANAGDDSYIMASTVVINGTSFDSVGVKYKGNSSYSANRVKNPFHIDLDAFKNNPKYLGYTDIKLGNGFSDPSFVREALGYKMLSNYMHCSQANFAMVYVNGAYLGLYSNAEAINKKFMDAHFYENDGVIVKCNPRQTGMGASALPNLTYFSPDSTQYYTRYEIKSDNGGWGELLQLCDTLNNTPAALDRVLDIDRALWMLAFNNVFVNLDSYTGAFAQNYYLYQDRHGLFNSIVWDLNMNFGAFGMTGSGQPLTVTQMQQLSPTLHSANAARPLIQKLLANGMYKRMYIAHMRTMLSEQIATGQYVTDAQAMMAVIDTAVNADPNKFFTYTQFQNSLTQNNTGGMGTTPGISVLMSARNTYLLGTTEFQQTPPAISNVAHLGGTTPLLNSQVTITAAVSNTNAVYLGYRYAANEHFTRVAMFDDGQHGDGAAGDGVYGADFTLSQAQVQYYIYADNANAGMFSPQRAEHEYYQINASFNSANVGDIVINELMAINQSTIQDANLQYEDWIELHNRTNVVQSLDGLYLTDNFSNMQKWFFPVGLTIPANGYFTIWADEDSSQAGTHCNFKLGGTGEQVMLSTSAGVILDSISYGQQVADISYGRYPNGTGNFVAMPPTYGAMNVLTAVSTIDKNIVYQLFPNPNKGAFWVSNETEAINEIEIFNIYGQKLLHQQNISENRHYVETNNLPTGLYLVSINRQATVKIVVE